MKSARKIIHDDQETAQLQQAVDEARAATAQGRVVSHEKVRDWLLSLATGERKAPPTSGG
jgi:predicted transcriptional regulator